MEILDQQKIIDKINVLSHFVDSLEQKEFEYLDHTLITRYFRDDDGVMRELYPTLKKLIKFN